MNLLPMFYYAAVVERKSITKAAEQLHITQQTLSAHIAALEEELGCVLFQRRPKFALTYAGEKFYKYVLQFQGLYQSMQEEFQDMAREERGSLSVGIAHTRGKILLPRLLPLYHMAFPRLEVQIVEDTNDNLISKLLHGQVDLIIANTPDEIPELCTRNFYQEEIILLVSRSLLTEETGRALQETKNLQLLADCPFLLHGPTDIAGRMGRNLLQKAGFVPKVSVISNNVETLLQLCLAGEGACFSPDTLIKGALTRQVCQSLIVVHLDARYTIRVLWQNKAYVRKAVTAFVNLCTEANLTGLLPVPEK
jgi:DNA-binding transcriptional LysR family regulator